MMYREGCGHTFQRYFYYTHLMILNVRLFSVNVLHFIVILGIGKENHWHHQFAIKNKSCSGCFQYSKEPCLSWQVPNTNCMKPCGPLVHASKRQRLEKLELDAKHPRF
jgi:hypothetical protein